ncbi:hypothetical protein [Streptosporangium pseudovulgare]|uniref:Transcription factor zinc-finger domain-containing protein n=1 Tax=Streptosporangium pseudovulgare TaxID=35765 RepID=A0ABQ2RBJ6_9ACTN|nr:hypothetical protein [Streptosporangium pseudovulgare]GGQ23625.1 hypothetical protein GCM10010140_62380 [Streptosporangium pseudovulgare]
MSVPEDSTVRAVTFKLNGGVLGTNGSPAACPKCGEQHLLTVRVVPDEIGETPTYVECPWGHLWAEPTLPQRVFAGLLAAVAEEYPEEWAALNRVLAERGRLVAGA